jgi:hypothetical protein
MWTLLGALFVRAQDSKAATSDLEDKDKELEYWNQVDDVEGVMEGIAGMDVSKVAYLTSRQNATTQSGWCVDWYDQKISLNVHV